MPAIRQGAVQHRMAQVTVPPPRGKSQPLREYVNNNLGDLVYQLDQFGASHDE